MTKHLRDELERLSTPGMMNPNADLWWSTCLSCKTKFRTLVARANVRCPFCDLRADQGVGIQFDSCDRETCLHDGHGHFDLEDRD